MSESNNNTPMRITQLQEAETFDYESYLAAAKAGTGTKKVKGSTLLAELIDIRQGADGTTYASAGDAVKAQMTKLANVVGTFGAEEITYSGTTGATYGNFTYNLGKVITNGEKYQFEVDLQGVTLHDGQIYGIISPGNYSSPLLNFTEENKKYTFEVSTNYIGFYIYINANEKGASYESKIKLSKLLEGGLIDDINQINSQIESIEMQTQDNSSNIRKFVPVDELAQIENGSLLEYSNIKTTYSWTDKTKGLVVNEPIQNAKKLYTVAFDGLASTELYFGLLSISNGTATIEFATILNFAKSGENLFYINFELDQTKTYYPFVRINSSSVSFGSNSRVSSYFTFSESNDIVAGDTYTLTENTGNGLDLMECLILTTPPDAANNGAIKVAKNGEKYSSINSAVAFAKTIASSNNPITILIYPGIYDEVVNIGSNKYISLIGVNRDTCIIRDTSGKYANSPVLVSGNFTLENLTIIANHDNAGSWYPTWIVGNNTTFASYCVHADGTGGSSEAQAVGNIVNCRLYSECNQCLGLGLVSYQTLNIINCEIERYVTDSHYLDDNYVGAIGCHSAVGWDNETEEHLILRNNVITFNDSKALQLWHYAAGSPMDVTAIGNALSDGSGITNVVYYKRGTSADYLTNLSFGNNTNELNY